MLDKKKRVVESMAKLEHVQNMIGESSSHSTEPVLQGLAWVCGVVGEMLKRRHDNAACALR